MPPSNHPGNNIVAQGLPQERGQASTTAHANAAIIALVQGCHGGKQQGVTSFGFANEMGDHGNELVLDERRSHDWNVGDEARAS